MARQFTPDFLHVLSVFVVDFIIQFIPSSGRKFMQTRNEIYAFQSSMFPIRFYMIVKED